MSTKIFNVLLLNTVRAEPAAPTIEKTLINLMFKWVATMALISFSLIAFAQNQHSRDSLQKVLQTRVVDTARIHNLILLADEYETAGIVDSAKIYIDQARELNKKYQVLRFKHSIDIISLATICSQNPKIDYTPRFLPTLEDCRRTGDKEGELRALTALGKYTISDSKHNELKLKYYQRAVVLSHELKPYKECYYLRQIADIHLQQLKYDLAEKELFQILNNSKADSEDKMSSTDLLTAVYTSRGQYEKALLYATKAVKIMQATKDSSAAMTFYGRLYFIHRILGNYSLSTHWARRALSSAIAINGSKFIYRISATITKNLLMEKKTKEALKFISSIQREHKPLDGRDNAVLHGILGDCYFALHNNRLAESHYIKMLSIKRVKEVDYDYNLHTGINYRTISDFYIKTGRYSRAKLYLLEAQKYFKEVGDISYLQNVQLSLFQADSALGNYKDAISHLRASNTLKDSMFNIAKNKQIEELNISYKTEEREKDLVLMRNKEKLEQIKLERAENTRDWIIGGSGLLVVIALLLYRQSGLQKKNNKVISHKNDLLQHLLTEKDWLLKEVHHRVKNNLHTVICLLESQSRYLENDALQAIETSQQRIFAMSLIHQKLYQSDDIKTINMSTYIPELVKSLIDGFGTAGQIRFNLDIEPIDLSLSHAIPLALIINEAVTNSIKYAFPDNGKGEILIVMKEEGKRIILELADNGIGMPQIDNDIEPESLGLRLIKGLSEDIDAKVHFDIHNGTKVIIEFKRDPLINTGSYLESTNIKEASYA
ncbi:tetratricopeptide repeat-containing sensor histidine kinase [Mucilaginibacter lappiensis]|uniref:tetratricopeptide repeat-containing sensor histidine kinase n=1 Tax=Mucilaginibacter lappiensis TaxID=354630 RepID=UPI003D1C771F